MPSDHSTITKALKSDLFPQFGMITLDVFDSDEFRALRGSAVRVYIAISVHAGKETMSAWPSQRKLARLSGLRRQTVNAAVQELVKSGLISLSVERKKGKELLIYSMVLPPSKRTAKPGAS